MLRGSGEENKAQKRVPPEAKCENMKCEVITETPGDSKMTDQGDSQKQKSKEEKRMLGEC